MFNKLRSRKFSPDLTSCRYIWSFAILLLPYINTACFAQTVIIRIVNVTDESPVKHHKVWISGLTGKGATEEEEKRKLLTKPFRPDLRLVTDDNGEAQFELPKPAPTYFYVRAVLSGPRWDCTCLVRVSTEDVMQKGFMVKSPGTKPSIQPEPGKVLFGLKPNPLWVQILYPLLIDHRL